MLIMNDSFYQFQSQVQLSMSQARYQMCTAKNLYQFNKFHQNQTRQYYNQLGHCLVLIPTQQYYQKVKLNNLILLNHKYKANLVLK